MRGGAWRGGAGLALGRFDTYALTFFLICQYVKEGISVKICTYALAESQKPKGPFKFIFARKRISLSLTMVITALAVAVSRTL